MNFLVPLAEQFVADQIIGRGAPMPSKSKVGLGFVAISGLLFCGGIGFLLYGSHLWLASRFAPDMAMIATGGLFLLASTIVLAGLCAAMLYRRKKIEKIKKEVTDMALNALELLEDEISEPIHNNPKTAVLIASAAGFLTGNRFL